MESWNVPGAHALPTWARTRLRNHVSYHSHVVTLCAPSLFRAPLVVNPWASTPYIPLPPVDLRPLPLSLYTHSRATLNSTSLRSILPSFHHVHAQEKARRRGGAPSSPE